MEEKFADGTIWAFSAGGFDLVFRITGKSYYVHPHKKHNGYKMDVLCSSSPAWESFDYFSLGSPIDTRSRKLTDNEAAYIVLTGELPPDWKGKKT